MDWIFVYKGLFLLFGVGVIAGFINVMAGGGSSLTLPALIFLGLHGSMANGTNRIASVLQNTFALLSFRKRQIHPNRRSLQLSLLTLPGAVIGAILAVNISDAWFKRILSLVLIGIVCTILFSSKKKRENQQIASDNRIAWMIYPVMLGIGFYGGFIQVGVGFLFMASLYHILKLDLVHVNMHKVFIVLIYTIPALLVFAFTGNVDWGLGLCLAAGNAVGAWWGAHFAVKGGEKVIRVVLAITILIISLKLLGVL